jgi:multiple sugar transport system permease protein
MKMVARSKKAVATASGGRRSWASALQGEAVLRWLMPAPAVLILLLFTVVPLARTVYLSFTRVKLGREILITWIGTENYSKLLHDELFWISLKHTATFTVVAVLGELFLGYVIALLLFGEISKWRTAFRSLFLLPMVLSPVVVGLTWRALLNPSFGWVNFLLGTEKQPWLADPDSALFVLAGVDIWQWTPFMFLLILAGLQSLPSEVLEAARVDGASSLTLFTKVIWPIMIPITTVAVLLRSIDAFKIFDLVYNLTFGGPGTSTETISFYMYRMAFKQFNHGYAAAVSVFLSIIVSLLVTLFLRLSRRVV